MEVVELEYLGGWTTELEGLDYIVRAEVPGVRRVGRPLSDQDRPTAANIRGPTGCT